MKQSKKPKYDDAGYGDDELEYIKKAKKDKKPDYSNARKHKRNEE